AVWLLSSTLPRLIILRRPGPIILALPLRFVLTTPQRFRLLRILLSRTGPLRIMPVILRGHRLGRLVVVIWILSSRPVSVWPLRRRPFVVRVLFVRHTSPPWLWPRVFH